MRTILLCFFAFFVQYSFGQKVIYETVNKSLRGARLKSTEFFSLDEGDNNRIRADYKTDSLTYLKTNHEALKLIAREKPEFMSFNLPLKDGKSYTIDVVARDIHATGFTVINARNEPVIAAKETYYRGIIRGDENSLVAFSISEKGINGFISDETGNYELIKSKDDSRHLFYSAKGGDSPKFECMVSDTTKLSGHIQHSLSITEVTEAINCGSIGIYFEADHSVFQGLGSVQAVTDYVNQLFVQVSTLYENEGINIAISQIKVWDTPDSYPNNLQFYLYAFHENWIQQSQNVPGDVAHALSFRNLGGGIAHLDILYPQERQNAVSVSTGLVADDMPTFIVSHELGHNFGSPHTHNCSWPGGPIDNCYPIEGDCSPGSTPQNGGTVMSYCFSIENIGISFANGFGELPGKLIRSKVANFTGTNILPTNITITDVSANQAYFTWDHPYPISGYYLEYKIRNSEVWTSIYVTNTWLKIKDLTSSTIYDWRLKSTCSDFVIGEFQTTNANSYCIPEFASSSCGNGFDTPLTKVTLDNMSLSTSSGCNSKNYTLFTAFPKKLEIGTSYNFSLEMNNDYRASIWIDLNGDKVFDTSELLFTNYDAVSGGNIKGTITIPAGILPLPITRMRIIAHTIIGGQPSPCGFYGNGEVEDYEIEISNCTFEVIPNSLSSTNNNGNAASLSWNHTSAGPFYIEYKESESEYWNGLWSNTTNLTLNGLSALVNYQWRVKTACSNWANSSFSLSKQAYCDFRTLAETGCSYTIALNKVTLDNTILSNSSGCSPTDYTFFPGAVKELTAGETYSFILERVGGLNVVQAAIWIDLNDNGHFEEFEKLFSTEEPITGSISGEFTVPFSIASIPAARMRIVLQYLTAPNNPCYLYEGVGDAEDYEVMIKACQPNNIPAPTGLSSGSVYDKGSRVSWIKTNNQTYQIEYRRTGTQNWLSAGETIENFYHLNSLHSGTSYQWRVRAACSVNYATGSFTTKTAANFCPVSYTLQQSCSSQYAINSVKIGGMNLSLASGCSIESYTFFPKQIGEVKRGETYSIEIATLDPTKMTKIGVWIDLNDNGFFELNEQVFVTDIAKTGTIVGSIFIPFNAKVSNAVRMRVVLADQWTNVNSPCKSYQLGETEDYLINIAPCISNLSPAPTALKSENIYDKGGVLSWTYGSSSSFELEYKKNNESEWNSIVIENGTSHYLGNLNPNTLYQWRVRAYCSVNYTASSFTTQAPNNYCDVSNQRICDELYYPAVINGVVLDNTVLSSATGCKEGAYDFFPYVVKTLEAGKMYSFSLSMLREDSKFWGAYIWLDLNGNGNFDSNEMLFGTNSTQQGTVSGTLTIPASTQTVLSTRLRITAQLYYEDNPLSPCSVLYPDGPGETEDYLINIYNPCPAEVILAHPTDNISGGTIIKEASRNYGEIRATNRITGNANVIYRAKTVELKPGFRADASTVFKAEVGGCN